MFAGRLSSPLRLWDQRLARGRLLAGLRAQHLTAICYHRVWRATDSRFRGYKPNISATPEIFTRQIDYLRKHYNPISARQLAQWLAGDEELPPHPMLITFDDGYRDNVEIAWPILQERNVPAVVFLATDHIGTGRPFVWDFAAYCFAETKMPSAMIPLVGRVSLIDEAHRDIATERWVEGIKLIPAGEREIAMASLASALNVSPPSSEVFQHLYLTWAEVKKFALEGLEFGAHTHTHPILTRLPMSEANEEIELSVERLTAALGARPLSFAYPNGSPRDYTTDHEQAAKRSGVALAFSLEPGPAQLSCVRRNPMAIPRIYVGERDRMLRLIAKLNGAARLSSFLRGKFRKISGGTPKFLETPSSGIGHF